MKSKFALLLLPAFGAACFAQEDSAPLNELAFGLGGIPALSRSDSPSLDAGSGVAFQVNYGRRFFTHNKVALYGEINFLASPLRDVSSSVTTATRDLLQSLSHAWNSGEVPAGFASFAIRPRRRRLC